jgi:methanol---5-hydroxybenzimidazolylcobamide Co-methyltransferase
MPDFVTATQEPRTYAATTVHTADDLVFGRCPHPVRCGLDLEIGAGQVWPEINFTLPPMLITPETMPRVREIYAGVIDGVVNRARDLSLQGLVVEFEQLPPMTAQPEWGAELTEILKARLVKGREDFGLRSALRVTIVDLREEQRPPPRRSGPAWEAMHRALELCAKRGADILSIESTGGKEVHDAALTRADVPGIVFALGVLAPADMAWLWDQFGNVARRHKIISGGDTACGFANTAMQLAGQKMLPDVLPAFVRALSAARSLVAVEHGAVGPLKDCGYENPVVKAITGVPIAMEGRSATCAHLSPIGNIAVAAADLWSNESVPDIRLLSGPAPIASLESLVYDCRLMNASLATGKERVLRDLHVASDARLSAQALLMTPDATLALAHAIVKERDPYRRALAAGLTAFELLALAVRENTLQLGAKEERWLDRLRAAFERLPENAGALYTQIEPRFGEMFSTKAYDLPY